MVKISIISLIYRSKKYADFIYENVNKYTPAISRGEAEFFFIANDPTEDLENHLKEKGYPHFLNKNEGKSPDELFKMGFGKPDYMHGVYRGYNKGILSSKGEIIVLLNSDNCVSPDWLENLLKCLGPDTIVTSQLVERYHPDHGIFPGAFHAELGNHPDNFKEADFLEFVEKNKVTGLCESGSYMPCAFRKEKAIQVGLYPEGNIAGDNFSTIIEYGDERFYRKLANIGVKHVTSLDSIVYHFKEGEMEDTGIEPEYKVPDIVYQQPNHFPLKPIEIRTEDDNQYLSFDTEKRIEKLIKSAINEIKHLASRLRFRAFHRGKT